MSTKLTIKEALAVISVSESSLRRDIKKGKVSSEKDLQGRRRIDVSELERVYGQLKHANEAPDIPDASVRERQMTLDDTPKIITLLEGQVQDLKAQLQTATAENVKLLDLADRLQKQNEVLMLPSAKKQKRLFGFFRRR